MSHVLWWALVTVSVLLGIYLCVWWISARMSRAGAPDHGPSQVERQRAQAQIAYADALNVTAVTAADHGHEAAAELLRRHATMLRWRADEPLVIPQPRQAPAARIAPVISLRAEPRRRVLSRR